MTNKEPFGLNEEKPQPPSWSAGNEKALAGLSYISQMFVPGVMPVILLLTEDTSRDPFVRYHAVQSLALLIASILYELAAAVVWILGNAITGGCLGCVLWTLPFFPVVPLVYYGWKAFEGESPEIPYLTAFLRDNGWLA